MYKVLFLISFDSHLRAKYKVGIISEEERRISNRAEFPAFGIIRASWRVLRCITRMCRCNVRFRSSAYRSETASRAPGWLRYFWNYANRPRSNHGLSAATDTACRNLYVRNYESTICCHPRAPAVESIIALRHRLAIKQSTVTSLLIYFRDIHVKICRANLHIFSFLRFFLCRTCTSFFIFETFMLDFADLSEISI